MLENSLTYKDIKRILPKRLKNSHKGNYGRILVIGGDTGMGGAAILTSESALMSGAGLVTLLTKEENLTPSLIRTPEVMAFSTSKFENFHSYFKEIDTVVCGVGFGASDWSEEALIRTIECCENRSLNLIIDAGALRLLANIKAKEIKLPKNLILTPHPGEAAELLKKMLTIFRAIGLIAQK